MKKDMNDYIAINQSRDRDASIGRER